MSVVCIGFIFLLASLGVTRVRKAQKHSQDAGVNITSSSFVCCLGFVRSFVVCCSLLCFLFTVVVCFLLFVACCCCLLFVVLIVAGCFCLFFCWRYFGQS